MRSPRRFIPRSRRPARGSSNPRQPRFSVRLVRRSYDYLLQAFDPSLKSLQGRNGHPGNVADGELARFLPELARLAEENQL